MDIDGSNIQNVTSIEGLEHQPSWTPDSSQILFWTESEDQVLYRQSPVPNPGDRRLIKSFSPGTHPVPGVVWNIQSPFSVSPEWKLVFAAYLRVSTVLPTPAILTMDIDGRNLQAIESSPPADAKYYSPAWSPDGQTIAYLLNFKDSNDINLYTFLELFVMNADGSNPRSLAKFETNATGAWASSHNDISLCWSPDGSKIAFNKKEEGNLISHIYIINPDGSGLTQVTFAEGVTDISVSWSN
jgi:Tol biopolymer transport system component